MSNTLGTLNPRALDSYVTLSVAGSANVTLTSDQAQKRYIKLTGALTGNITVFFPFGDTSPADAGLEYTVENATTGAFTVTIASQAAPASATWTAGSGKQIFQGNRARVAFVNTSGTTYDFVFTVPHVAVLSITLSPATLGSNTNAEQSFTTPAGSEQILATDAIAGVAKPTTQAGVMLVGARALAGGFAINFGNSAGTTPTPTAGEVYKVTVVRI